MANKPRDILKENGLRPALIDDSGDVAPDPSFVVGSFSLSGAGEGLTGEAANDEIHSAAPRSSIEGGEVRPDRSLVKDSISHTRRQDRGGRDFPLHVADRASARHGESESEVEHSDASAERQDSGMCSHTQLPPPSPSASLI